MTRILLVIALMITLGKLFAQQTGASPSDHVLVVGIFDKSEDRYSIEVLLTELLNDNGIKAIPSLNVVKTGSDLSILASDSMKQVLELKGIDHSLVVSIRGYDRKFKPSAEKIDLKTALSAGNLFALEKEGMVSISFELQYFKGNDLIKSKILKCGNVSTRDSVLKRCRKHLSKEIPAFWKNKK